MGSHFENIEYQILKSIKEAKERLLIAVAWFTNNNIASELCRRSSSLEIEVIVDDNEVNRKSQALKMLKGSGVIVDYINRIGGKSSLMHNKFCVIDNLLVITGSYNWTNNAKRNDENIVTLSDDKVATMYSLEFRRILDKSLGKKTLMYGKEQTKLITQAVYDEFVILLRKNVRELKKGLLVNYSSFRLMNMIRVTNESIRVAFDDELKGSLVYLELLSKYRAFGLPIDTPEGRMEAESRFRRRDLDKFEGYLLIDLYKFKARAIKQLQHKYTVMLKDHTDRTKQQKILSIHQFIAKEKTEICRIAEINMF